VTSSGGGPPVKTGGAVDDVLFSVTTEDAVTITATKVAKGGTNLLTQFSKSTIDDAVNLVMRNSNNVRHIFARKHNLESLVNNLGGQENTIRAVLNAGNGRFPSSGIFRNLPVNVSGQVVYLRGSVVNGIPRIGTMFIP